MIAVGPGGRPEEYRRENIYMSYRMNGFMGLCLTDRYIYGLYWGKYVGRKDPSLKYKIHVYDYRGRPVKRYTFDEELISFAVDEERGKIYATVENQENPVFVYEM